MRNYYIVGISKQERPYWKNFETEKDFFDFWDKNPNFTPIYITPEKDNAVAVWDKLDYQYNRDRKKIHDLISLLNRIAGYAEEAGCPNSANFKKCAGLFRDVFDILNERGMLFERKK